MKLIAFNKISHWNFKHKLFKWKCIFEIYKISSYLDKFKILQKKEKKRKTKLVDMYFILIHRFQSNSSNDDDSVDGEFGSLKTTVNI